MSKSARTALLLGVLAFLIAPILTADDPPSVEIGSQVITPTVSTALTVPADTVRIVFSVRNAGVHLSLDGTAATTSDLYIPPGLYKIGDDRALSDLRFINSTDGASTVTIKYFRNR